MKVMLTGESLAARAGSTSECRNIARGLQSLGHSVMVYGSDPAQLPRTIEIDWIPVVSDPSMMQYPPDIIHACHPHDVLTALAALPRVPAILQCSASHDNSLPHHPRIFRRLNAREPMPATRLVEIYRDVITENDSRPVNLQAETAATLEYLRRIFPRLIAKDLEKRSDWSCVDRFLWQKRLAGLANFDAEIPTDIRPAH